MGRLGRVSLLVLDDWGLQGFSAEGRRDLLEIVEARHGRKSILIASQIPVERWPEVIGDRRARKRAIVGVARKLLIALWRYATQGLVPEGTIVS